MKVLVTVKPVADPNTAPSAWIASQEGNEEGVNFVANYFDLIAVEQAIRLREIGVEEICLLSVTHESKMAQIRSAIAMGADRSILIDAEGKKLDWYQIAAAFKKIIEREQPAFVLMGKQATDDDASQVGPILAHMLGWPQATFVSELEFNSDKTRVKVGRETDEGVEVLDVALPAIITCDLRLNEPRYATLPNLINSKPKPVEWIKYADLGGPAEAKVTVEHHAIPPGRGGECKMVADAYELVATMKSMRLVD
jgi:electron transfer flavoprotein beta subunit